MPQLQGIQITEFSTIFPDLAEPAAALPAECLNLGHKNSSSYGTGV
jgi:hypothetical protein